MKIHAFYFSPTGGTKKVLNIILSVWDCEKYYYDLSDKSICAENVKFEKDDFCVIAVPSFSGRVPQFVIPKLQGMKGNSVKAIMINTYGNRAFDDALLELKNTLEGSGFLCIAGIAAVTQHSVMPKYGMGRPDSQDIKQLKEFARRCKNLLAYATSAAKIPGNVPYRKYLSIPIKPRVNKMCNKCGACVKRCPVDAILPSKEYAVDKSKCISCLQCIKICPKQARYISKFMQRLAEIKMKKLCETKKENYLYLPK